MRTRVSAAARMRGGALALIAVFALAACSPPPSVEVARAVAATLDQDLTFRLSASADRDAIAALGDDAEAVTEALRGFSLLGQRGQSGTVVGLRVLGGLNLVQLTTLPDGAVFVRTDVRGLLGEDLEQLLADLRATGAPESVVRGVSALFNFEWVGITGEAGLDGLLDGVLPDAVGTESEAAQVLDGDAVDALVRTLVSAAEIGAPEDMVAGARRYPITFDAAEVADGLDAASATVAQIPFLGSILDGLGAGAAEGDVVVSDGFVVSVVLRLVAGEANAGRLELTLDLDDFGDVPTVGAPAGATIVDAQDLADALVVLLEAGQGN